MKKTVIIIIGLVLFLAGCVPKGAPTPELLTAPEAATKPVEAKAAWEVEWETWYSAAKKEGKISVIGSGPAPPRQATGDAFKKKYGITIEDITVRTGLLGTRVLTENRAGIYTTDILVTGTTSSLDIGAAGLFESIKDVPILPEAVDPRVWWKGKIDYPIPDHTLIALMATPSIPLAINTNLVKLGEEPKTWKDLLNLKWKGKILLSDPRVGGNALSLFTLLAYYVPELGLDFWREIAKQEPVMESDAHIETEWLAKGKVSILIAPSTQKVTEFIEIGAPIRWIVPEGPRAISSASTNVGLLKKAPHPNAAKMYINFLLTKEGQYLYSVNSGYQSGRVDVPTEHLEPIKVRQPGVKYIETYHGEFLARKDESIKAAQEIFKNR